MKFKWDKKVDHNYTMHGLRIKMAVLALTLFLLWDCDYGLWNIHVIFFGSSRQPIDGAPHGQLWEFYFWGHLHHWASFVGMTFAANHPVTSLLMRKLEAIGPPSEIIFKSIVASLLVGATAVWAMGPFSSSIYVYDATNPYFGLLPVLCYVYLRNSAVHWRNCHVAIFKAVGAHSLEIYLLHHHLFLAGGGTAKKTFIPGYPACNFMRA